MNPDDAAHRWRRTWEEAWPNHDIDAIAALYAVDASYRALAFRDANTGVEGVRRYLRDTFAGETEVHCRFGEPITRGSRAAVEWWASLTADGRRLTLAGTTILRFDDDGLVADHRDYWNQQDHGVDPYTTWSG